MDGKARGGFRHGSSTIAMNVDRDCNMTSGLAVVACFGRSGGGCQVNRTERAEYRRMDGSGC